MKRKRDPEATRQAIMAVAAEMFAELGFDGATVERIARRARVNKAMISYHFGGKRQLYRTLIGDSFQLLGRRLDEIQRSGAGPEDRLAAFLAAFREVAQRRPAFPPLMLREAIGDGRHLDPKDLQHFLRVYRVIQEILEQGAGLGRFHRINPAIVQIGLIGSLTFYFSTGGLRRRVLEQLRLEPGDFTETEYLAYLHSVVVRGLAPEPTDRLEGRS